MVGEEHAIHDLGRRRNYAVDAFVRDGAARYRCCVPVERAVRNRRAGQPVVHAAAAPRVVSARGACRVAAADVEAIEAHAATRVAFSTDNHDVIRGHAAARHGAVDDGDGAPYAALRAGHFLAAPVAFETAIEFDAVLQHERTRNRRVAPRFRAHFVIHVTAGLRPARHPDFAAARAPCGVDALLDGFEGRIPRCAVFRAWRGRALLVHVEDQGRAHAHEDRVAVRQVAREGVGRNAAPVVALVVAARVRDAVGLAGCARYVRPVQLPLVGQAAGGDGCVRLQEVRAAFRYRGARRLHGYGNRRRFDVHERLVRNPLVAGERVRGDDAAIVTLIAEIGVGDGVAGAGCAGDITAVQLPLIGQPADGDVRRHAQAVVVPVSHGRAVRLVRDIDWWRDHFHVRGAAGSGTARAVRRRHGHAVAARAQEVERQRPAERRRARDVLPCAAVPPLPLIIGRLGHVGKPRRRQLQTRAEVPVGAAVVEGGDGALRLRVEPEGRVPRPFVQEERSAVAAIIRIGKDVYRSDLVQAARR